MSLDQVRSAYAALVAGDVDPLVSLLHPELHWRGRRSGPRLWRRPPS